MWGYDYEEGAWVKVATNASGELGIRRGETLDAQDALIVPMTSGGIALGSNLTTSGFMLDRVILRVPEYICTSGVNYGRAYELSGVPYGIWVGGRSGPDSPFPGSGCITSGHGLFLPPGSQKELYVQDLSEIRVCSEIISGYPVTWVSELIIP